jgi:hypothetical protein
LRARTTPAGQGYPLFAIRLGDVISSDMTLTHDHDGTPSIRDKNGRLLRPNVVMCHTGEESTRRSCLRHATVFGVPIGLPDEHQCARVCLG